MSSSTLAAGSSPARSCTVPVVVTEPTSTTYVQPGWDVIVDPMGNLVARAA